MKDPMLLTWLLRHGAIRGSMKLAAVFGEPHAQLTIGRAARQDPYPVYRRIRARGGVVRGTVSVMAAGHAESAAILRSDTFRTGFDHSGMHPLLRAAATRAMGAVIGPLNPPSLLVVNPPEHTRYRRQVARVFTARAVMAMEDGIREHAHELLGRLEGRDRVDLVEVYARQLPVIVVTEILGIPAHMRDQFLVWGDAASSALDLGLSYRGFREGERALTAMNTWMYEHIARLRREPGEDFLSRLVHLDGEKALTDVELMATVSLVLAAGFETTASLLSSGARLLTGHPEQLELLRADPSLWPNAVEEVLRYEAPVQETVRSAAVDTEIGGLRVAAGELIGVMIGAANRDPQVFGDPDRFDITRPNARDHLTFSAGLHHCLGSALARMEGRIGLSALFDRYPGLTVAGPTRWRQLRTLHGLESLPVSLGPPAVAPAAREAPAAADAAMPG